MSRISESNWTSAFLKDLRRAMPNAEIIKFNSFGALTEGGIPDFSVTRFDEGPYSKTIWCEVKLLPAKSPLFKPLQLERLKRLGGWYLIWDANEKMGWFFRANEYKAWPDALQPSARPAIIKFLAEFL